MTTAYCLTKFHYFGSIPVYTKSGYKATNSPYHENSKARSSLISAQIVPIGPCIRETLTLLLSRFTVAYIIWNSNQKCSGQHYYIFTDT